MIYNGLPLKKATKLAVTNYKLANVKLESLKYIFILEKSGECYLLDKTSILRQYFFFSNKKEFKSLIHRFKSDCNENNIKLELF